MPTPHLGLPYIAQGQAQKEVTHNVALNILDGLVQLSVKNRTTADPPTSPMQGDRWIVPAGATGAWAGKTDQIAHWFDAAWTFTPPQPGWRCFIEDEGVAIWLDGAWQIATVLTPNGASILFDIAEEEVVLAGAATDTAIAIPNRAIVLAVSTRTIVAVTGAASFDCGTAAEPAKFGGSLGSAAGSTNSGVIGPTAFYAPTPVRLTANGGSFTGGWVRVAIHFMMCGAPQS